MLFALFVGIAVAVSAIPESRDELKKWKIRELSDWADSRGLKCKGCAEKADYIQLVWDNKDLPEKQKEEKKEEPTDAEKDAQFAELEKMLKDAGVKGKAFNRKDMEEMMKNIKKEDDKKKDTEKEKEKEL